MSGEILNAFTPMAVDLVIQSDEAARLFRLMGESDPIEIDTLEQLSLIKDRMAEDQIRFERESDMRHFFALDREIRSENLHYQTCAPYQGTLFTTLVYGGFLTLGGAALVPIPVLAGMLGTLRLPVLFYELGRLVQGALRISLYSRPLVHEGELAASRFAVAIFARRVPIIILGLAAIMAALLVGGLLGTTVAAWQRQSLTPPYCK